MKFTPEYIELCKSSKVQGLRRFLKEGDKVSCIADLSFRDTIKEEVMNNPAIIWLPTGDQLDQEIVKIISNHKSYDYKFVYQVMAKIYYAEITDYSLHPTDSGYYIVHSFNNTNPLIAKISLLIQLLKGE